MKKIIKKILPFFESRQSFRQFLKFCIVGGTCAATNFAILYVCTEWFGLWYVWSNTIAFFIAGTMNFLANKFWTFSNTIKGKAAAVQLGKFLIVVVAGIFINNLILYFLTDYFGLYYLLSWVFSTGIVTFWNYLFNRFWTFKNAYEEDSQHFIAQED